MESSSHTPLFVLRTSHFVPLTGHSRGHQLKYRVIGVNADGQSVDGTTAAVVL